MASFSTFVSDADGCVIEAKQAERVISIAKAAGIKHAIVVVIVSSCKRFILQAVPYILTLSFSAMPSS